MKPSSSSSNSDFFLGAAATTAGDAAGAGAALEVVTDGADNTAGFFRTSFADGLCAEASAVGTLIPPAGADETAGAETAGLAENEDSSSSSNKLDLGFAAEGAATAAGVEDDDDDEGVEVEGEEATIVSDETSTFDSDASS
jgi:hypothetical protein